MFFCLFIRLFLSFFPSPFIHLFIYSFIHLFIYSFIHLFIYSFIHLFIYSFIHLFIYSFIHLFIYSFIHLFIYSFSIFQESELTDEEKDETLEGIKGAVEGITFMEVFFFNFLFFLSPLFLIYRIFFLDHIQKDNFMTSTSNLNKHGRWWTLLTSCFSHSFALLPSFCLLSPHSSFVFFFRHLYFECRDFYHFLGNMVAMWLFGFKVNF